MKDLLNVSANILSSYKVVEWGYTEQLEPTTYQEFLNWVENDHHGPLKYLADHRKDKRASLKEYVPDCESAVSFLFDYRSTKKSQENSESKFKIASYTTGFDGEDYHFLD